MSGSAAAPVFGSPPPDLSKSAAVAREYSEVGASAGTIECLDVLADGGGSSAGGLRWDFGRTVDFVRVDIVDGCDFRSDARSAGVFSGVDEM